LRYEEFRPLVLEALKNGLEYLEVMTLIDAVQKLFFEKGLAENYPEYKTRFGQAKALTDDDRARVRMVISELVTEGILSWGADEMIKAGPPHLTVTEYGQLVLNKLMPQPYDPDGYLAHLQTQVGGLDGIVELYIVEATQTLRRNNLLSAAVMTGVASERTFDLLLDAVAKAITGPGQQERFEKLKTDTRTKHRFDEVKKAIMKIPENARTEIDENLESDLDGIFNLIRITRNDAGHPTGKIMRREQVFVNLQLFVQYCRCVYGLIEYLNKNKI
jgi:hypothetical protein